MSTYKYIQDFPKPFLNDLISNRCLPIIGAGFSKNAEIPKNKKMLDWDELGKAVAGDILEFNYTNALDAISAYCHEYSRTNLIEKLSELLHVNAIKPGKTHKAFCDLQFDTVCTTNFEFLLEQGYNLISKPYKPIIDEAQLSIASSSDSVIILKIHGDLNHPNRLVVTEEDYDRFLSNNPMFATYLANLLITRTPIFIGYSLDDSDFRQIWQVIKDRLGNLRRQAYVLKVDCSQHEKARFERRGVKVINIKGNGAPYSTILEEIFKELKHYWNNQLLNLQTISEEATLAELALPNDTNNRLCFFSIPLKLLPFYKKYIFPIVQAEGLVPITADDVISVGDNWMAKVSALINKSEFIVIDLATQNTIAELGLVINQKKNFDRVLIICPENEQLAIELQNLHSIIRSDNFLDNIEELAIPIETWFKNVLAPLKMAYDEEPNRLLNKKEYKAAIISAMTLLEIYLRDRIEHHYSDVYSKAPTRSLFKVAYDVQLLNLEQLDQAMIWSQVRNKLVHSNATATAKDARTIVQGVYKIINPKAE